MTNKTPKQRAIDKTRLELTKDIDEVIFFAKHCGTGELFYYLHYLHFLRVIKAVRNIPDAEKETVAIYFRQTTDAYKYLIQLLYKHHQRIFVQDKTSGFYINPKMVVALTKSVLHINSKYETLTFLTLFNNIEISGERDQFIKLNMDEVTDDDRLNKFFYYALRADSENDLQKEALKYKDDFLNHFRSEYLPYHDLFQLEFEIALEKFIEVIDFILEIILSQINKSENKYTYLENGKIDIQAYGTIMNFANSLLLKKQLLLDKFGEKIDKVIQLLTFNVSDFDEHQLRYNLIARQPILDYGGDLLVSPELLLDSLFVNSHYSLLESGSLKEEYKKRYASTFIDKICGVANKYGYTEVTRELELYEGKNQLGDIDLMLKDKNDHFLLIEAKNHSIPMDVYFHDYDATEKRLNDLLVQWEKKVNKRYKHLETNFTSYGISAKYSYLIISKFPEILSHFSEYLVLTINEFEYWLKQDDPTFTFQGILEELYRINENKFTSEQMEKMQKDLVTGWRFEKE